MKHLLNNETDTEMRKYLLNLYLEEFRTTLFRQTMFAEFEDMTHKAIEDGQVLTAEGMCEQYEALNARYYGDAVEKDNTIKYEWARIPHFYNAFYVYKYATGYSAATAFASAILSGQPGAVEKYLGFLHAGGSDYSLNILKNAGVDLNTPQPVTVTLQRFAEKLQELKALLGR